VVGKIVFFTPPPLVFGFWRELGNCKGIGSFGPPSWGAKKVGVGKSFVERKKKKHRLPVPPRGKVFRPFFRSKRSHLHLDNPTPQKVVMEKKKKNIYSPLTLGGPGKEKRFAFRMGKSRTKTKRGPRGNITTRGGFNLLPLDNTLECIFKLTTRGKKACSGPGLGGTT